MPVVRTYKIYYYIKMEQWIMKNKLEIQQKLLSLGFLLGTYDKRIDQLQKEELSKILDNIEYGNTDIGVTIDKDKFVLEIFHVDNEVDFNILTPKEYTATYGRIFADKH
jgi:hypothetical protein